MKIKALAGVALVAFSVTASTHAAQAYSNPSQSSGPMAALAAHVQAYQNNECGIASKITDTRVALTEAIEASASDAEAALTKLD